MAKSSRITELADIISTQTKLIDDYLQGHGLAQPSFEIDAPAQPIPPNNTELAEARTRAVEASIELQQLLQGVDSLLLPETNLSSLQAINRFKIASAFPVGSEISLEELAEKTGLNVHDLSRIIRFAISHHRVFCEPKKGVITHSAASKRIAESELLQHISGLTFEEVWPAHAKGFALANGTTLPFYEYLEQHPARAKRFGGAMSSTSQSSLQFLADNISSLSLPTNGLVLDVGGSQGHVSAFLAAEFPSMRFIVQDFAQVVHAENSTYRIPEDVKERVELMPHDFLDVQTVKDVDVVVLRFILHNWSDEFAVRILRNLLPALKKGARIVIQDHVLPEPGTLGLLKERQIRSMDLIMLTLFNARERDEDDWKRLFELTDPRLRLVQMKRAKENEPPAVVIVEWEG